MDLGDSNPIRRIAFRVVVCEIGIENTAFVYVRLAGRAPENLLIPHYVAIEMKLQTR